MNARPGLGDGTPVDAIRRAKAKQVWEHHDCGCPCHQQPGERERIAFHFHQFEHGCYGDHCPESERLYAAWQAALAAAQ